MQAPLEWHSTKTRSGVPYDARKDSLTARNLLDFLSSQGLVIVRQADDRPALLALSFDHRVHHASLQYLGTRTCIGYLLVLSKSINCRDPRDLGAPPEICAFGQKTEGQHC